MASRDEAPESAKNSVSWLRVGGISDTKGTIPHDAVRPSEAQEEKVWDETV